MASPRDEDFLREISGEFELTEPTKAPAQLKARLYSALARMQAQTGPLMSLTETHAGGQRLCIFEHLVRIVPVGETVKSLNICRICHARVLAENFEDPPIYWPGCPYTTLKNS